MKSGIISIDNMYEDDGLANLYGTLNSLLNGPYTPPPAPTNLPAGMAWALPARPSVVGITFEWHDGRLNRANIIVESHEEQSSDNVEAINLAALLSTAGMVVALFRQRQEAEALAEEKPITLAGPHS